MTTHTTPTARTPKTAALAVLAAAAVAMAATFPSAAAASPVNGADLRIEVGASPDPTTVGGRDISYDIFVHNDGPGTATAVIVTDALPAGLTLVSANAVQGSCSGTTTVKCNLGSLGSGYGAWVGITARPTKAGMVTNAVSVNGAESDPVSSNNTAKATTTVNPAPSYPLTLGTCSGSATPIKPGSCTRSIYVPSPSDATITFTPSATFAGNFRIQLNGPYSQSVTFSGVAAAGVPVRASVWLNGGYWDLSVMAGGVLRTVDTTVKVEPRQICFARGFCYMTPGVYRPGPTVSVPGAATGSFSTSVVATGPA